MEQRIDGDDPDLHVVAVAELAVVAAVFEEGAALLLVPAAGWSDLGEAALSQPDCWKVDAHCLSRPLRVVGFAAAIDAGMDAVIGELPLDALVEVMPRRGVDERPGWFGFSILEPVCQLFDSDLGLADADIDAYRVRDRRQRLVAVVLPGVGVIDGE